MLSRSSSERLRCGGSRLSRSSSERPGSSRLRGVCFLLLNGNSCRTRRLSGEGSERLIGKGS